MKIIGQLTWCRWSALHKYGRERLATLHFQYVRCIFSKTGVWNPRLTNESRLEIEDYWRDKVKTHDESKAEEAKRLDSDKAKFYALSMFPYPSGKLHLGHVRVYTISDVMARYQRALGKAVIHPMGWDAFGLPAENAAIERGIPPKEWTYSNIQKMKEQLQNLGLSLDWSRELATCDPAYYKWTQWLFLKMFENGLAFQKKGLVNWDPVDMTVLANEQIDNNGCSWRSGAKVEQKYLTQWYLRTTVFSKSLLEGLDEVDPSLWRDIIKLQKNWISECKGHRVDFKIESQSGGVTNPSSLTIYTENVDLLYGVSHIGVAASHHLCVDFGVHEEGSVLPVKAIHPLTGDHLHLVVVDESEMLDNHSVVLGIPSISETAKATADKNGFSYHSVLDENGHTVMNSKELHVMSREDAVDQIQSALLAMGCGGEQVSAKLTDWLISRQRYWGTPIPVVHCNSCGVVPVPYEDLPVELPDLPQKVSKSGHSPLADIEDWVNTTCPCCGGPAKRETDTMDTFVDSTWYFLRYLSPQDKNVPFRQEEASRFMPVDLYVGGKEHAVLHLYFARFVCHFLHKLGLLPQREPFQNLLTQGMVKGQSYRVKATGKYITEDQVDFSEKSPREKATGAKVVTEFEKMSKSKYNGVDPEDVLREFGVDSTRLCMVSNVSPHSDRNWSNEVYKGVLTWQGKVWTLITSYRNQRTSAGERTIADITTDDLEAWEAKIDDIRNHIINNVNFQLDVTFHINSAISRLHSFTTWLGKVPPEVSQQSRAYERALGDLIVMTSPIAPHFASELWAGLRECALHGSHHWASDVLDQSWPKLDDDFMMPLTCRINNVDVCEVGVPYKTFHELSTETAVSLVQRNPVFQQTLASAATTNSSGSGVTAPASSPHDLTHCHLRVDKGHKALLSFRIPGLDLGIDQEGSTSEKNRQAKKLGKKKKKLRTMEKS